MTAIAPHEFDLRSLPDAFYEDPFPTYRRLRTETPILELPGGGGFGAARERTTNLHKMDIEDGLLLPLIDINT